MYCKISKTYAIFGLKEEIKIGRSGIWLSATEVKKILPDFDITNLTEHKNQAQTKAPTGEMVKVSMTIIIDERVDGGI